MRIGILGGGNPHALCLARHLRGLGIDCFGIGRGGPKVEPLWLAPQGYRYHKAHLGCDLAGAMSVLWREKPEIIVNFAAQGESAASFGEDSWRYYATNCAALARLVCSLRGESWLRLFVQVSTSELYGSTTAPAGDDAPVRPTSPYALSKATFDAHLEIEHRLHGFPMIIVRPSNCYVEGQQLHRVVPRAAISAVYGREKLRLEGGGRPRKSYMHTDDLARAIVTLTEVGVPGQVFNVGPDAPLRIIDLVNAVADAAGVERGSFVEDAPERFGEDGCYWIDSSRAWAAGWRPRVSLPDGLARMVEWVRRFPDLATMPKRFEMKP